MAGKVLGQVAPWWQVYAGTMSALLTSSWNRKREADRKQGQVTNQVCPSHPLLPTVLHLLKILEPSKTVLPTGDQMLKHRSL